MNKVNEQLADLNKIRSLMEQNTKFLSLSGLSGIIAGIAALSGIAVLAVFWPEVLEWPSKWRMTTLGMYETGSFPTFSENFAIFVLLDALVVLAIVFATALYFTRQKAVKLGLPTWNRSAKQFLLSLGLPLLTGGILCVIELSRGNLALLPAYTLLFYGLALLNGAKYTLNEIRYLGLLEISLGLLNVIFPTYSIFFWGMGFGGLHIIYGVLMYLRYEK